MHAPTIAPTKTIPSVTEHTVAVLGRHALTLEPGSEARAAIMLLIGKWDRAPYSATKLEAVAA